MKKLGYRVLVLLTAAVIIFVGVICFYLVKAIGPIYLHCGAINIIEAYKVVGQSECAKEGKLFPLGSRCNKNTGWWEFNMIVKDHEGCFPACVIDTQAKKAEMSWRCTGALPSKPL